MKSARTESGISHTMLNKLSSPLTLMMGFWSESVQREMIQLLKTLSFPKQKNSCEISHLEPSLWQEENDLMVYRCLVHVLCSNSKCWVIQVILQMPIWALQHQRDPAHMMNWLLYSSLLCLCRNNTDSQEHLLASHSWSSLSWTLLWHLETLLHEEILKQHKTDQLLHYISSPTEFTSTAFYDVYILAETLVIQIQRASQLHKYSCIK